MDLHLVVLTVQLFVEAGGRTRVVGGGDFNDNTNRGGGDFNDDGDDTTSGSSHFDNDGNNSGCFGGGHLDNADGDDTTSAGRHFDNDGINSGGFGGNYFDNDGDNANSAGSHFDNDGINIGSGCFDDGDDTNSNDGRCLRNNTPSPEPVEHDETFHQHNYGEQLHPRADMTSDGNMMLELVDHSPGQLAAGFLSSNASYILQMQGGGHVGIDMPPHEQVQPDPAPVVLIRAIWSMSLMTLVPAISTALYKPASGVVFGHNKLSYYLILSVIVTLGLGEAFIAFWLSRPGGGSPCRMTFGRAVLCASVLPFAAVLGIAGYGYIQG